MLTESNCGSSSSVVCLYEDHSTANYLKHPSNFIAGRPKAAVRFWFFGDFRCGALLFIVILVIYKYIYKNR